MTGLWRLRSLCCCKVLPGDMQSTFTPCELGVTIAWIRITKAHANHQNTNEEAKRRREKKVQADNYYIRDFDMEELRACIGILHWIEHRQKHIFSWTFFAILYSSWDISGLVAVVLILSFTLSTSILSDSAIEFPDPENIRVAVGISLISCLEAEIYIYFWFGSRHLDFLTSGFKMETSR